MAHFNQSSSSVIHRQLHNRAQAAASKICFLADVEGHLDYFYNFVKMSECMSWKNFNELVLHEGYEFVFGGDATDKGPGSMRFLETLLQLKHNYPERVHWLLGNRDLNKMRFTTELSQAALDPGSVYSQSPAYWLKDGDKFKKSPMEYLSIEKLENTPTSRLKWMLEYTMGSGTDFEFRRQELHELDPTTHKDDVTDEAVTQSYVDMVQGNGLWTQYLRLGKLALVIQSVLFVHGGIFGDFGGQAHQTALGYIPGQARSLTQDQLLEGHEWDLKQWTHDLNNFAQDEIERWEVERDNGEFPAAPTLENRAGNALLNYGMDTGNPTVVYTRPLKDGMPVLLRPEEVRMLAKNGITTLLSGHTPHGTCPTVIPSFARSGDSRNENSNELRVTTILTDTSYSHFNYIPGLDHRGTAASEVIVNAKDGQYYVHGDLEDETKILYTDADPYIGRMLSDGFFVKAKLETKSDEDESMYLTSKVTGFKYEYQRVTEGKINERLIRQMQ